MDHPLFQIQAPDLREIAIGSECQGVMPRSLVSFAPNIALLLCQRPLPYDALGLLGNQHSPLQKLRFVIIMSGDGATPEGVEVPSPSERQLRAGSDRPGHITLYLQSGGQPIRLAVLS